jgi:hypothetical protein
MNLNRWYALALLSASCLSLLGCPNPNVYATARTTPKGQLSHSLAAEAFGFSYKAPVVKTTTNAAGQPTLTTEDETRTATVPTAPTYVLRWGVAEDMELAFKVSQFSSLGLDYKLNFLKGETLDLAVAPGGQFMRISSSASSGTSSSSTSATVAYLHLPLILDINLGETVSFVLTPGVTYGYASASVTGSESTQAVSNGGVFARGGLGLNLRLSPGFAMQPEMTLLRNFESDATTLYIMGLGFNFGSLPSFGTATPSAPL